MTLDLLTDNLLELWGDKSTYFGCSLTNPQTGEFTEFQAQTPFHIASAYKVFVLGELLKQYEAGKLSFEETITLSDQTRIFDSSYTDEVPNGNSLTILELAKAMMGYSDNTATEILQQRVGPSNVKALLHALGNYKTRFQDSLTSLMDVFTQTDSIDQNLADKLFKGDLAIISTPAELTGFYQNLFLKQIFQKRNTLQIMKEILAIEDANQRVQWPAGVVCFRKSGNIDVEHYFGFSLAGVIQKEETVLPFALCLNFSNDESVAEMLTLFKKSFALMKEAMIQ